MKAQGLYEPPKDVNFTLLALGVLGYYLFRALLVVGVWCLVILALCWFIAGQL